MVVDLRVEHDRLCRKVIHWSNFESMEFDRTYVQEVMAKKTELWSECYCVCPQNVEVDAMRIKALKDVIEAYTMLGESNRSLGMYQFLEEEGQRGRREDCLVGELVFSYIRIVSLPRM